MTRPDDLLHTMSNEHERHASVPSDVKGFDCCKLGAKIPTMGQYSCKHFTELKIHPHKLQMISSKSVSRKPAKSVVDQQIKSHHDQSESDFLHMRNKKIFHHIYHANANATNARTSANQQTMPGLRRVNLSQHEAATNSMFQSKHQGILPSHPSQPFCSKTEEGGEEIRCYRYR